MAQTATFCIVEIKDIELIKKAVNAGLKKSWLGGIKKITDPMARKLEQFSVEKIPYRWAGASFAVLAVFSREKLGVDWENLQYSTVARELSEKNDAGVYIFSIEDQDLHKLRPTGFFYSIEELNEYAIELKGSKPANPNVMKYAVETLEQALAKLTNERVVILLIEGEV
jgi:hypothetical protein